MRAALDIALGFLFAIACGIYGLMAGGFLVGRVFASSSQMGWDRLADALGGMFVGGLIGLAAGVLLWRVLEGRRRTIVTASTVGLTLLWVLIAWSLAGPEPMPEQYPRAKVATEAVSPPADDGEAAASTAEEGDSR